MGVFLCVDMKNGSYFKHKYINLTPQWSYAYVLARIQYLDL